MAYEKLQLRKLPCQPHVFHSKENCPTGQKVDTLERLFGATARSTHVRRPCGFPEVAALPGRVHLPGGNDTVEAGVHRAENVLCGNVGGCGRVRAGLHQYLVWVWGPDKHNDERICRAQ